MKYQVVQSNEIVWCPGDDRHILIMKENGNVVGINYCQGDDIEYFMERFNDIDHKLTNFYLAVEPYLVHPTEVEKMNAAIWAYFEYCNLNDSLSVR